MCREVNSLAIDGKCRQIHLPHATFSHVQSLHRSHSTDDMCTLAQAHVVRRKLPFIHASCLILCCSRHLALPHLLFLLTLLCCCRLLLRTQTCCQRIQLSTAKIHGRMALLRNIPLVHRFMSPKGSSATGFWSNHKIKKLTTRMILKKLVSKSCPPANHWYTHSADDSAASIAPPPDSDFEDEQLRKMLASPLFLREREEHEGQTRAYHSERESLMIQSSRNPEVSGKPDAECVQKREANAQRTQAPSGLQS